MRKLEDVVIHMKSMEHQTYDITKTQNVKVLFGETEIKVLPRCPYDAIVYQFLDVVSKAILEDSEARRYPDIVTFGFWIRKANIIRLAEQHEAKYQQQGKGLVFHIAPSNVPINFAYTLVFGLLSGNSNIVRVSSKAFIQYEIICRIIDTITNIEQFSWVRKTNAIIGYDYDDQRATDYFSSICDTRIIWGGDSTIDSIRKSSIPPRTTEITFADRYSLAILSLDEVGKMTDDDLKRLVSDFYNDTYLMDQNACSSPHLVCWCPSSMVLFESKKDLDFFWDRDDIKDIQDRFWAALHEVAKKYDFEDIKASEKYTILCESAIVQDVSKIKMYDNILFTVYLKSLPKDITVLRGKFGLFYNFNFDSMEQLIKQLNSKKIQTIATVGIDKNKMSDYIFNYGIVGVDRIVSVGKTLDIDAFWDGYDVISALVRNIVI